MIKVTLNLLEARDFLIDLGNRQIPFAASRALNDTALGVQDAERASISQHFTLRRPEWTLQGVKIPKFSNKNDTPMSVRVIMDSGAGRGDIMTKFETGGTKTPRHGANLAVPIGARPSKASIVPKGLQPRALNLRAVGKSIRGDQRTFLLPMRGGRFGIYQRTGKGQVRLLYVLKGSTPLPSSLHFYDTATRPLIEELWALNFAARFEEAMRTAR